MIIYSSCGSQVSIFHGFREHVGIHELLSGIRNDKRTHFISKYTTYIIILKTIEYLQFISAILRAVNPDIYLLYKVTIFYTPKPE